MSASTEKKRRQAAREAGTDKKILAQEMAAKEHARQKRLWAFGTVAVVLLIALIVFLNSGLLFKTTALSIQDESWTAAEMNYSFSEQYYYTAQQYGNYASLMGLNTANGIKGLDDQPCPMMPEGGSWKDYFLQNAQQKLRQEKALCDYAAANDISLSEEEAEQIDASFADLESIAKSQGYASANNFFAANYGTGVNTDIARQAALTSGLANKAMMSYADSLQYSDKELEEKYQSYEGARDYFDYAYYYVVGESSQVTAEDGSTSNEVSAEALAKAEDTAKTILAAYEDGEGEDYAARLDEAVASQVADAKASHPTKAQGSSLGVYKEWLMDDSRKAGDSTMIADSSNTGYYVLVFISRDDNDYQMAQVRHILVKAKADENGEYSDEAKAEAKAQAEKLLEEFMAGDQSEDSFAAMAQLYSEDSGSKDNGGLYDSVIKGQMVPEFDKFCFEGHEKGDTAIVYGESAGYAGYHVMYFVGQGDNYARRIALDDLRSEAVTQWIDGLTEGQQVETGFGMRLVGK